VDDIESEQKRDSEPRLLDCDALQRIDALRRVHPHDGADQARANRVFQVRSRQGAHLAKLPDLYGKFMLSNRQSQTNPETGKRWGEPEVAETVDLELLRQGQPLDESRAMALAAFLTTLTDQRYESLLER
jgi:hypothetical protein